MIRYMAEVGDETQHEPGEDHAAAEYLPSLQPKSFEGIQGVLALQVSHTSRPADPFAPLPPPLPAGDPFAPSPREQSRYSEQPIFPFNPAFADIDTTYGGFESLDNLRPQAQPGP